MALQAVFIVSILRKYHFSAARKYENYRRNTLLKRSGYKLSRNVVSCVLKFDFDGLKIAVNKVDFYDEFQTKGIFPGSLVRFSAFRHTFPFIISLVFLYLKNVAVTTWKSTVFCESFRFR